MKKYFLTISMLIMPLFINSCGPSAEEDLPSQEQLSDIDLGINDIDSEDEGAESSEKESADKKESKESKESTNKKTKSNLEDFKPVKVAIVEDVIYTCDNQQYVVREKINKVDESNACELQIIGDKDRNWFSKNVISLFTDPEIVLFSKTDVQHCKLKFEADIWFQKKCNKQQDIVEKTASSVEAALGTESNRKYVCKDNNNYFVSMNDSVCEIKRRSNATVQKKSQGEIVRQKSKKMILVQTFKDTKTCTAWLNDNECK